MREGWRRRWDKKENDNFQAIHLAKSMTRLVYYYYGGIEAEYNVYRVELYIRLHQISRLSDFLNEIENKMYKLFGEWFRLKIV